jgi:hypothetical protein
MQEIRAIKVKLTTPDQDATLLQLKIAAKGSIAPALKRWGRSLLSPADPGGHA